MPLFHKEPFVRRKPPKNVQPDDELFLCKLTGEVFADYEKFFESTIMCNSLVWTCSVTGRPGLTFQEALDSEEKARQQLESFPKYFRRPVLYLASLTHRSRLSDMNDDLFHFYKDRYFIGEVVETVIKGERRSCKVSNIMPPEGRSLPEELNQVDDESSNSDDVICLDDDEDDKPLKPKQKSKSQKNDSDPAVRQKLFGSDTSIYQYVLQDLKLNSIYIVNAQNISRKKGIVSREKCKLFLKQHCTVSSDGIWRVKSEYIAQYSLNSVSLDEFFNGPAPMFEVSEAKRKPASASTSQKPSTSGLGGYIDLTDEDMHIQNDKMKHKASEASKVKKQQAGGASSTGNKTKSPGGGRPSLSAAEKAALRAEQERLQQEEFLRIRKEIDERQAQRELEKQSRQELKEELKKRIEEEREKKREEKKQERAKQREEKRLEEEKLRFWNRPREDLECDDLKDLPVASPVECPILQPLFGDVIAILEFVHCFSPVFKLELPTEMSLATLLKALTATELSEVLSELVRQLLAAIFSLQDEQTEKEARDNIDAVEMEEYKDKTAKKLVSAATTAAQIPHLIYGTPLQQLEMDEYTLTEVLRLHLISSGAYNRGSIKSDYQQRGGYTPPDDPGLDLQRNNKSLIQNLSTTSFFSLSPGDKLKIINVLIQQLLTYATCRDFLEDNFDRLRQIQKDLRNHQINCQKRERDENFYWLKKRMETGQDVGPPHVNGVIDSGSLANPDADEDRTGRLKGKKKKGEPTDKDYEQMPTENLDWEKINADERSRIKDWERRRDRELNQLMAELQHSSALYPIGRDRAFRRYWVFRSVPGLFIENDEQYVSDDYVGSFLGDVIDCAVDSKPACNGASEEAKSEMNGDHDKTNTSIDSNKENISDDVKSAASNGLSNHVKSEKQSLVDLIKKRNQVQWSYYNSPEDLETLIESLNSRGFREGPLKAFLTEQKRNLSDWMTRCDTTALSNDAVSGVEKQQPRKGGKNGKQVIKSLPAEENLEFNLRELLLDLEERIYTGSLGQLKCNRDKWREAILEGQYENKILHSFDDQTRNSLKQKSEVDLGEGQMSGAVRGLAHALLQVSDMIESRYLNPPLGEGEKPKRGKGKAQQKNAADNRSQDSSDEEDEAEGKDGELKQKRRTVLERWRDSVTSSSSLSQIFLHLSVLDSSITWSKSALFARCRICKRKGDGERMLLCDGCDRGHHMYCLKPPVKEVPHGDWYCPDCRPKQVAYTPRKNRKSFCLSDEEEESESSEEETQEPEEENEEEDEEEEEENDDDNDDDDDEADDTMTHNTSQSDSEVEVNDNDDYDEEDDEEAEVKSRQPAKIKFQSAKQKKLANSKESSKPPVSSSSRRQTSVERVSSRAGSRHSSPAVELVRLRASRSRDNSPAITGTSREATRRGVKRRASSEDGEEEEPSNVRGGAKQGRWSLENSKHQSEEGSSKGRGRDGQMMKVCEDVVTELMQRDEAWPFLKPVLKKDAPDYYNIIQRPMDFSTIRNKIRKFEYDDPSALLDDIRVIFRNYKQYNMPTAPAYVAGRKLESYFEKRVKELKLNSKSLTSSSSKQSAAKNNRKRTL